MNITDLVRRFYEQIWNRGDKVMIPEILREGFTFRGSLGQTKRGHDGFTQYVDFVSETLLQNTDVKSRRLFAMEVKYLRKFYFPVFIEKSIHQVSSAYNGSVRHCSRSMAIRSQIFGC